MPASRAKTPDKPKQNSPDKKSIPVLKLTREDLDAMRDAQKETGIASRSEVLRQAVRIGLPIFVQTWKELRARAAAPAPTA